MVVTFLSLASGTYIVFAPAAQFQRNLISTLWFVIFEKNKFKHVDYRNYIPGKSDEERWTWLAHNIESLCHSNREKIETVLPQAIKVNESPNTFVFRITKRLDDEKAFSDKFYALRIQFDKNDRVNKLEIFHVETDHSETGAF